MFMRELTKVIRRVRNQYFPNKYGQNDVATGRSLPVFCMGLEKRYQSPVESALDMRDGLIIFSLQNF